MGNTCDLEECCGPLDDYNGAERRQRLSSDKGMKFSQKDLIKTKKQDISKDYIVLSPPIGKGSFGSVYKVVNRTSGMVWAAKKIPLTPKMSQHLQQICILKQLDHPNIIRIIDIYEQEFVVYVIMEFCKGGELFQRIVERKTMTEGVAKDFMKQLLSSISYCHLNHIIHRDLKPQNIMLMSEKQNILKIIDFGAGTFAKQGEKITMKVGSVYYIAPEVIKKSYDQKCDIWSLGVIMYMMLSGVPPFNGKTDKDIFDKILKGQYSFYEKKFKNVSLMAKDLIARMLEYKPEERISARQALNHPWFTQNNTVQQSQQETNLFIQNQLSSIKDFCQMNKFKECIVVFIAHNLSAAESLEKMNHHFKSIDKNNDGRISFREFQKCYREYMPQIDQRKTKELFERLDKNDSGYIDYSEFMTSMISSQLLENKQTINKAFDMIDSNKDGLLQKQQILTALGGMEESLYQEMMKQCDTNNDGFISREQFLTAILNISQHKIKEQKNTQTRAETKSLN